MLPLRPHISFYVFFFNDTATTEIYTLSLHDALPICARVRGRRHPPRRPHGPPARRARHAHGRRDRALHRRARHRGRSEEHTSELQSRQYLVCRLLLEKKKKQNTHTISIYKHHEATVQ